MSIRRAAPAILLTLLAAIVFVASACGDGADAPRAIVPTVSLPTPIPGSDERVTLSGTLTLDGAPLESDFLGVRVVRDGLPAACQNEIPPVTQGRYEIPVAADAEVRGCGAPGAELLLWTYAGDAFVFSAETLPWPGSGETATFDASFSTAEPEGASTPVTEFKGHLFDREGGELPGGTVIEAYAGDVPCGVTSLRHGYAVERFYTLIVAGPQSVAGCAEGGTLTFQLDGAPALETAVNDLLRGSEGHELDLSLR